MDRDVCRMLRWSCVLAALLSLLAPVHATPLPAKEGGEELRKPRRQGVGALISRLQGLGVPGPWYGFVPQYEGFILDGISRWKSDCFTVSQGEATRSPGGLNIKFEFSEKKNVFCDEALLLATPYRYLIEDELLPGKKSVSWALASPEELKDFADNGIQVFRFPKGMKEAVENLYTTAKLFVGALTGGPGVPKDVGAENLEFLEKYAAIHMPPRTSQLAVDPSWIQSGDFLGVVRLDGLDPLIMWGTGSHLGHTTMALRDEEGRLYVVESQEKSAYWPQDRIQKTEFSVWMEWAKKADYSVIWMPLRPEIRKKWDNSAAWEAFGGFEGLLYGFPNMLWGWVDTPNANMPDPLTPELMKVAFALADPIYRKATAWPSMWNAGWAKRLGLPLNLTTAQILAAADAQGSWFRVQGFVFSSGLNFGALEPWDFGAFGFGALGIWGFGL